MRVRVAAALLALASLAPSTADAGPWAPEPGHGYVRLWLKYFYGYQYIGEGSVSRSTGDYHEASLAAYAELGLFERVGLVLHAPLVSTYHLEDPRDGSFESHLSPGDPTIAVRWQFLSESRFVAAFDAGLRIPFARPGPVQTLYTSEGGNEAIGELQVGTGIWDVPLGAGVGYAGDEWYAAASGQYVLRTDGYDHAITWLVEGGFTLFSAFGLRARVSGYHSIDVWFGDEAPGHTSMSGIGNGTNWVGYAIEGDYQFDDGWAVGGSIEGGAGAISRHGGGPVVTSFLSRRF